MIDCHMWIELASRAVISMAHGGKSPPVHASWNPLGCTGQQLGLMCRGPLMVVPARLQVNNGVYKSGFATTQSAYERAQSELWRWLDILEDTLSKQRFLTGSRYGLPSIETAQHEITHGLTLTWMMLSMQVHTGGFAAVPNTRTL